MSNAAHSGNTFSDDIDFNSCLDPSDLARIFKEAGVDTPKTTPANNFTKAEFIKASRTAASAASLIDKYFREMIEVTENGQTFRITKFDAIIRMLYAKALANDHQALTALLRYSKFGNEGQRPEQRVIAVYNAEDGRYFEEFR